MEDPPPCTVATLWLAAREKGWGLDEFLNLVRQHTLVRVGDGSPQIRYLQYCRYPFETRQLEGIEPKLAQLPVRHGQTTAPSSVGVNPLEPPEGSESGVDYQVLAAGDAPREGRNTEGVKLALLSSLFLVIVIGGFFLSIFSDTVHPNGLPGSMLTLFPICSLCMFLLLGVFIRAKVKWCRKFFLPSSVVGGIAGLIFIQVMRKALDGHTAYHMIDRLSDAWEVVPGVAINIVFATLFLGNQIPRPKLVWNACSIQLAYGQLLAWGQYVIGLSFGTAMGYHAFYPHRQEFGVILPIGFEGGHGTAEGMKQMFTTIGWPEGHDFCVAAATIGLLSGLTCGIILINWYRRFKAPTQLPDATHISTLQRSHFLVASELLEEPVLDALDQARDLEERRKRSKQLMRMTFLPASHQEPIGRGIVQSASVDSVAYHIAVVLLAVMFGYGCKAILITLDGPMNSLIGVAKLFTSFPVFPIAMLGGIFMQIILQKAGHTDRVDRETLCFISNTALEFLVVAAVATVKLNAIAEGVVPFALLMAAGVIFQVLMLLLVAPRLFLDNWFERAITELGQSLGVTATGLLLLKLVDPGGTSPAYSAFALKQLLHEPFMGGGIWTSVALPLTHKLGAWPVFGIAVAACVFWVLLSKCWLLPALLPYQTVNRLDSVADRIHG
eukprot:Sspe_Gene.25560::Locus_10308_Transcript_2_2_Confidence_0.500_Length_2165::g.25560::m.25560/K03312/gltS; glutamate:Na+ symporter, ESS family